MLDINKIPPHILGNLKDRGHTNEEIAMMTPKKAFSEYCNWHGLSGWGDSLAQAIKSLDESETFERAMEDELTVLPCWTNGLTVRTATCLVQGGFESVEMVKEALRKDFNFCSIPNFGKRCKVELLEWMSSSSN